MRKMQINWFQINGALIQHEPYFKYVKVPDIEWLHAFYSGRLQKVHFYSLKPALQVQIGAFVFTQTKYLNAKTFQLKFCLN